MSASVNYGQLSKTLSERNNVAHGDFFHYGVVGASTTRGCALSGIIALQRVRRRLAHGMGNEAHTRSQTACHCESRNASSIAASSVIACPAAQAAAQAASSSWARTAAVVRSTIKLPVPARPR
jgi:hypothetical protein